MQANDFRDALDEFDQAGYSVVGISPDTAVALAAFAEELRIDFTFVSDEGHQVMEQYGAWGEHEVFGRRVVSTIRATFVIDETGKITRAEYGVKAPGHVARLAAELGVPWPA
jgi:peroxiredoxin Q/BCP